MTDENTPRRWNLLGSINHTTVMCNIDSDTPDCVSTLFCTVKYRSPSQDSTARSAARSSFRLHACNHISTHFK